MPTYNYTNTNNAIKVVKGPAGPRGITGLNGATGATGDAGAQGPKGPGNLGKTDISFSGNKSASYLEVPVGEIKLIGHTTTNNLPTLTSVKAIVGADTGDTLCKAGLYLVNHSTENSGATDPMIIASNKFEIKGLGRTKDFKIIDFTIDSSLWPTNDDVIGLWAYIEYPKEKIKSYLSEVERLYGAKEAVTIKEALIEQTDLTRSKFYTSLTEKYGIQGSGIIPEEQNKIIESKIAASRKLKLDQEATQKEEEEASLRENRRTVDYKSINNSTLNLKTWVSSNIELEVAYLQFG